MQRRKHSCKNVRERLDLVGAYDALRRHGLCHFLDFLRVHIGKRLVHGLDLSGEVISAQRAGHVVPVAVFPSKQLHAALIVLFKRGKITFYFVRPQSCALQRAAEYLRVCALAVFIVLRHLRIQRGNLCGLLLGLFDRIALHGRILSMHRVHGALIFLLIAAVLHLDVLHRRLKVLIAAHARGSLFK